MKKTTIFALATLLTCSLRAFGIEVAPGQLRTILGDDARSATSLTLTGSADARDLAFLASLPALRQLDMSGLRIEAVHSDTAVLLQRCQFPANTVPAYIFALSKLEKVSLPATAISIEECAFASANNLAQVTLGSQLRNIGDWAFYSTAITAITLPASVDSLGIGVFAHCTSLESAQLASSAVTTLPAKTFRGCTALNTITFPTVLTGIEDECFMGSGLQQVQLPSSLRTVGHYAFSAMPALTHVNMTDAEVGVGAFYANPVLSKIEGVTSYPALSVAMSPNFHIDSVTGMKITSLGEYALAGNKTRKIWLSDNLQSVGSNALSGMDSLRTIMGYHMHGSLPETATGAFDDIEDLEQKALWVNKDHINSWLSHPEWSRFHIIGTAASVDNIETDLAGGLQIECGWIGDLLSLSANEPMSIVTVYDTAGAVLAVSTPRATDAALDLAGVSAKVIVVRATTAKGAKTFKLRRSK